MDLKEMYSPEFYSRFSELLEKIIPSFEKEKFQKMIFSDDWEQKELKARMRHTTQALHQILPPDFTDACRMIEKMIGLLREKPISKTGFEFMFFPDYIELYGLDHYETAVKTMETITQFTSCEFAVRPFILKYGKPMMKQMIEWSKHESADVRRLASEGSRPRLPWAIALPAFKNDPSPLLPILENLKDDPSEMVRRSVANNLNDIAKDHPEVVVEIAEKWNGTGKETAAIIRHGCRTLLKQGHPEILKLYRLESCHIQFSGLLIPHKTVPPEGTLTFSFSVSNKSNEPQTVRMEYAIFFYRKNGEHSKKVFKISERVYQPGEQGQIEKKHSFRPITTRKYYPGPHRLSIIINGKEQAIADFALIE